MRSRGTVILSLAILVCAVAVYAWAMVPVSMAAPSAGPRAECPTAHWSNVTTNCKKGADGKASGNYGGDDWSLTCGGTESVSICNDTFEYTFTVDTSSHESCTFTGDRVAVTVKCGNVDLRIN